MVFLTLLLNQDIGLFVWIPTIKSSQAPLLIWLKINLLNPMDT